MKRMFYVSRFARPLSAHDLDQIHDSAVRYNSGHGITGILVCLGDTFFQVLEGKPGAVDHLYNERILPDDRHKDVLCLKVETGVQERQFPEWDMKVFNLNREKAILPMAFRQMLTALLESSQTIARYTQPSVFRMLERGINPTEIEPRRRRVTVLFSDIVGFSRFAEGLEAGALIDLVSSHAEVCTDCVTGEGGEVNKLLGDGVLAYFSDQETPAAIRAGRAIVVEMRRRRAQRTGPHQLLYGGVGLANGVVYEGNIGPSLKKDFTILGNTVNQASRLESLTRQLGVRLTAHGDVVNRAANPDDFYSLGEVTLKGQSKPLEVFSLRSLPPLDVPGVYERLEAFLREQ